MFSLPFHFVYAAYRRCDCLEYHRSRRGVHGNGAGEEGEKAVRNAVINLMLLSQSKNIIFVLLSLLSGRIVVLIFLSMQGFGKRPDAFLAGLMLIGRM